MRDFFTFMAWLAAGILLGIYGTWLLIGLCTLIPILLWMRVEHLWGTPGASGNELDRFRMIAFSFTGFVYLAWFTAMIGRPIWLLLHGHTIRIAVDQFIR